MLKIYPSNIKALIFAIFVFVLLDLSVLALSVWQSIEIERHAMEINLAGRQRMLSQRLTKELLLLESDSAAWVSGLDDLRTSRQLFSQTLQGFVYGGETGDSLTGKVYIQAITEPSIRTLLREASVIWEPVSSSIESLLNASLNERNLLLTEARQKILQNNKQLLNMMNVLTASLEQLSIKKTARLRNVQAVVVFLAVLNFLIIVRQFFGHIQMSSVDQKYLSALINKINASVLVSGSDGVLKHFNLHSLNLFGYHSDKMSENSFSDLVTVVDDEIIGHRADGSTFVADLEQNYLENDDESLIISTLRDITHQRVNEDSLRKMAYHDALTNLPNRLLVVESLNQDVARAHRYDQMLAVCFIDLDGFKAVNDTYGHSVGDEVLQEVASRVKLCARESDTIGRLGGDEFVIVFSDVSSRENAGWLAKKIIDSMSGISLIDNHQVEIGASVGVSMYPEHSRNPEVLLDLADKAMYVAKTAGKGRWRFYETPDNNQIQQ